MKIAYLISAYTEPEQLGNLVKALDVKEVEFFIHIDAKVDINPFLLQCPRKENIHFLEKRERVCWGGFSQVRAIMKMTKSALDTGIKFERLVSMTGTDYPVMSNAEIVSFFRENKSKEIICAKDRSHEQGTYLYYVNDYANIQNLIVKLYKRILHEAERRFNIQKKHPPKINKQYVNVYSGSDYWALTRECAQYVYHMYENEQKYNRWMSTVHIPSEKYVQTILCNSAYKEKCMLFDVTASFYDMAPLHYVIYKDKIKILNESDYDDIIGSGKMLARKLYAKESAKLMEMLELHKNVESI